MRTSRRARRTGQILPLFALSLVVVVSMAALLFDGAGALVTRRRLQNASDAAALAGSNVIQAAGSIQRCSATAGPPPGAPRSDIVNAVYASIDTNLPGFDHGRVIISCQSGWDNQAVAVQLATEAPSFFAGAVLGSPISVGASSTAVNGQIQATIQSVVVLDPANAGWPNGRRGCPSVLLSGGPTVVFEGTAQIDSACSATDGGALSTNGTAASLTQSNGSSIRIVGDYKPGALTITPAPLTGQPYVKDPLESLEAPSTGSLTLQSSNRLILNNATQVLSPGIYRGGIQLRNSSIAYLLPGIYYVDGGGIQLGAQSSMFSIPAGSSSTTASSWATDCGDTNCGVLIYNAGSASGSGAMGQVDVSAGATVKLRAYDDRAVNSAYPQYRNLLLFQGRTPAPSSTYAQPVVSLNGGGSVDISGTIYAPGALVAMGGTSGGSGGGGLDLTLQFICWDMTIQGNASFTFRYRDQEFARPTDYGLVQ